MNVLLSWMREFVPEGFGEYEEDPEGLAEVLTNLGLVVESVSTTGANWDGIVVAKVLDLRPHPEADKIQLVDVDTGGAAAPVGETLQICCGAFNMSVGDLVPLATLGTVMPGGLEIARRKLRGEWSNGMICSETELGVGEDADGIMVLDPAFTVGQPLTDALGVETDVVFDIDVEGNRPDGLSVVGIARDLAGKLGLRFVLPEIELAETEPGAEQRASVEVVDPDLCLRFGARVLDGINIGPSPSWMQRRLEACGQRPINAIVDISNYVMLEVGQPNHTFDLATVPDGAVRVRFARDGETLTTLDEVERSLTAADGLVCNGADQPISLAGVMGGAATEISDSTTSVLLEAAVWDRMAIAKTSRRLGLRSEASTRFERGVDPFGIERALDRFCQLAIEICGATVAAGRVVVDGSVPPPLTVDLRIARVNKLLNIDLDAGAIAAYLDPIGFSVRGTSEGAETVLSVEIPTWRPDCSAEIDLIEEIGRHHGYEKSGSRVPTPAQTGELTPTQRGRRRIRRVFMAEGCNEAMPLPFLAPGDLERAGLADAAISLANPLVAEESMLRTSLLPGLLGSVAYNQSRQVSDVRLFELGAVYLPTDDELPVEEEWVAAIVADADATVAVGMLRRVAAALNLPGMKIVNKALPGLHPTRSAEVQFWGKPLGEVGEVDPGVLERFDVSGRAAWLQLRVPPMIKAMETAPKFKPVSRYPASDLDLAFLVPDDVAASDVVVTMRKAGGALLESAELFDVFRSDSLDPGVRSLAYRLRLRSADATLTDAEVNEARLKIIGAVQKHHNAPLR
jgi:phenylalanyl-tRNA synthetase beta chain